HQRIAVFHYRRQHRLAHQQAHNFRRGGRRLRSRGSDLESRQEPPGPSQQRRSGEISKNRTLRQSSGRRASVRQVRVVSPVPLVVRFVTSSCDGQPSVPWTEIPYNNRVPSQPSGGKFHGIV